MIQSLSEFLAAPAGMAFQSLLILTFADFATGVFAALRDGTFALSVVAAFLRKHVLGRSAPLLLLLFVGHVAHADGLTAMGAIGAAAYTLELLASIAGNVRPPASDVVKAESPAAAQNPVPTE